MKNNNKSMMITWGGNCKSSDLGELEGKAIVFGSEEDHDLSPFKDFFDDKTYVHPESKFITPLFFEHGVKYEKPIGKATVFKTESGWDAVAQLDMDLDIVKEYFDDIKNYEFGFSSGAAAHVVHREEMNNGSHRITQWPFSELSITRTPAEPKAQIWNVKSIGLYYDELVGDDMENDENDDENIVTQDIITENTDSIQYYKDMNAKLIDLIQTLIEQLVNKKFETVINPTIEDIKLLLDEIKNIKQSSPSDSEGESELTVLKSENEELKASNTELLSSVNEKEALLSKKVALLSETQEELEIKTNEILKFEEAMRQANDEIDRMKTEIQSLKELNIALRKVDFTT